jgi:hypothetical protein
MTSPNNSATSSKSMKLRKEEEDDDDDLGNEDNEKDDGGSNRRYQDIELDGIQYRVSPPWIRQYLCHNDTKVLGPIVGRWCGGCDIETNESRNSSTMGEDAASFLSNIELDPIGYGGEYVMEVLDAKPVVPCTKVPQTPPLLCSTPNNWTAVVPTTIQQQFQQHGLAVWKNAIPADIVTQIRTAILQNHECLLSSDNHGQEEDIRSDNIRFVSRKNPGGDVAIEILRGLALLEHVVAQVVKQEQQQPTVYCPDQGMCALYSGQKKAHYTWHYDNERDEWGNWRNYRTLTAILYLNPLDWDAVTDGGQLECEGQAEPLIAPVGGTIVLFDSCKIRHRVLPAHRDRVALTQWFVKPHWDCPPQGYLRQKRKRKVPTSVSRLQRRTNDIPANKSTFLEAFQINKQAKGATTTTSSTTKNNDSSPSSNNFSFDFFA